MEVMGRGKSWMSQFGKASSFAKRSLKFQIAFENFGKFLLFMKILN